MRLGMVSVLIGFGMLQTCLENRCRYAGYLGISGSKRSYIDVSSSWWVEASFDSIVVSPMESSPVSLILCDTLMSMIRSQQC